LVVLVMAVSYLTHAAQATRPAANLTMPGRKSVPL
jgi:hypothetical protein